MTVIVIKEYNDLELGRIVKKGEEIEVTEERAARLISAGVAEFKKVRKAKTD